MFVNRFKENPIILPAQVEPSRPDFEVVGAFNAGATRFGREILLLLRVAERPKSIPPRAALAPILDPATGEIRNFIIPHGTATLELPDSRVFRYKNDIYLTSISHFRLARSTDGIHFTIDKKPAVFPETEYETYGIEDPRITQIGDDFWITYKPVSKYGICTGLLHTTDFVHFERKGILFCPENIDVVLVPGRSGDKFVTLTRPVVRNIGPLAIWSAKSVDLLHWGDHKILMLPRPGMFDGGRIGASCVPIKTRRGWLEIYHGADENNRYCLAAALLDLDDPTRLIARSDLPLMHPSAPYEIEGFFGNVVFSCGAILDESSCMVTIYYGAADTCTAGATVSIDTIMGTLKFL
jgi:predicted GH43/DUF377 family glycosyl hydrolase